MAAVKPGAGRRIRAVLAWHPPGWLEVCLILVICGWLAMHLWGAGLSARWGLIDDHVILDLLGPDHRISASEILSIAGSSEVRLFGSYVRFRPAYYGLQAVECWLWGDSPGAWYGCRVVLFGASLAACMWLLVRVVGLLPGILFALYLAAGEYWASIWSRLGPAETYAAFGAAIFFLSLHFCVRYGRESNSGPGTAIAWAGATIGAWIAIGSKENFVLLALPALGVLWWQYRRRTLSAAAIAGTLLIAAGAGVVALAIGMAVARSGHDVYMQSVSAGSRAAALLRALVALPGPLLVLAAVTFAAPLAWLRLPLRDERRATLRRYVRRLVSIEWALAAAYAAQLVYYNGGWTAESRYAFPGEMIAALMVFAPAACWLCDPVLAPGGSYRRLGVAFATASVLAVMVWNKGFGASIAAARQNARSTQTLDRRIRRVAEAVRKDPHAAVALWSSTLGDYEAYDGIRALLRAVDVRNPITIRTPGDSGYDLKGFTPELARTLLRDVRAVQDGLVDRGFAPNSILKSGNCYSVGVSMAPPAGDPCRLAGNLF